jgi:serine phosphatase RsbU (regulator of sigma subunit)
MRTPTRAGTGGGKNSRRRDAYTWEMKIRTQLILAFLVLSVVPLSGIVLYSYFASQRTLRQAVEADATAMTHEMEVRMSAIRDDLGRGLQRLGALPVDTLMDAAEDSGRRQAAQRDMVASRVLGAMGDAAPLVESIAFTPDSGPAIEAKPPAPAGDSAERRSRDAGHGGAGQGGGAPGLANPAMPAQSVIIPLRKLLIHYRSAGAAGGGAATGPEVDDATRRLDVEQLVAQALRRAAGAVHGTAGAVHGTAEAARGIAEAARQVEPAGRRARETERRGAETAARRVLAQQQEQLMVLGERLAAPVRQGDRVVGHVSAQVSCPTVLRAVLARSRRDAGEIPFALNAKGQLYAIDRADEEKLKRLPLAPLARAGHVEQAHRMSAAGDDWVVVTRRDPATGLVLGIARPIGRPLHEVARTAGRNFGYGLSLIAVALVGILPLSRGMTRDLKVVTEGAERIAEGDLSTRVPVRSRSELGQLARSFNRMAEDLTAHQQQLIERELEQRLLRREYDRKTAELEEARRFQLALLPKTLPDHPDFAIAVSMRTATEVGGDYYDFHLAPAGEAGAPDAGVLTVAIGDATGHGARAGTMVTAIKGLLSADFAEDSLSGFLTAAARAVRRMDLGRMAMALTLARLSPGALTVSAAGMPPVLVYRRRSGAVEEVALPGMPLGGMACDYRERRLEMAAGDTVLLTTDGLPELANAAGDPLGYPRVRARLAECGQRSPEEIIAHLTAAADAWTAGQPPKDDMTLVVVQVRRAGAAV